MFDKASITEIVSTIITLVTVIAYIANQFLIIKQLRAKVDKHEETINNLNLHVVKLPEAGAVKSLEDTLENALKDQDGLLTTLMKEMAQMVKREGLEEVNFRLDQLDKQRSKDVLDFTNVLSQFNGTLIKLDTTIGHFNITISEVKETIKDHDRELKNLNEKIK
jgi:hypothetical protein